MYAVLEYNDLFQEMFFEIVVMVDNHSNDLGIWRELHKVMQFEKGKNLCYSSFVKSSNTEDVYDEISIKEILEYIPG